MSIYVSGIRLPFDKPEYLAIDEAYKKTKLSHTKVQNAFIYRVSIDARRGKISKVYTVILDGVENEQKIVEKLNDATIRCRKIEEFKHHPEQYRVNKEFLISQNYQFLTGVGLI